MAGPNMPGVYTRRLKKHRAGTSVKLRELQGNFWKTFGRWVAAADWIRTRPLAEARAWTMLAAHMRWEDIPVIYTLSCEQLEQAIAFMRSNPL